MATLVIKPQYSENGSQPYYLNVFRLQEWTQEVGIQVQYMKRMSDEGEIRLKLRETSPLPDRVFATATINDTPVEITAPTRLNLIKTYIYHPELKFVDYEELRESLRNVGVVDVKVDHHARRATLYFHREKTPQLPHSVPLGWDHVRVKPAKPRPLRCYCCQAYGHVAGECKNPVVCARCAGNHDEIEVNCQRPVCCAACGGKHTVFATDCKVWEEECEIARIRHTEKISYRQALLRQEAQDNKDENEEEQREDQRKKEDKENETEEATTSEEEKEETKEKEGQEDKSPQEQEARNQVGLTKVRLKRPSPQEEVYLRVQPQSTPIQERSLQDQTGHSGGWQPVTSRKKKK